MESILTEAEKLVNGDRQADYADPVQNFKLIAMIATCLTGETMTPIMCCKVMQAVKLSREAYKHKRDNLVDLVGYTWILDRLIEAQKEESK